MKENEIKFKLNTYDGKTVEILAEVKEDGELYRMGKPILCNCSGNTQDTATPFQFINGEVVCPECGRKSESVFSYEDYVNSELSNIHLKYFGTDFLTMQELYKISYTLPYEEWVTVSDLFMKLKPDMVDMGFFEPQYVGWVTSNPEEVEERLGVKPELRVKYLKEKQEQEQEQKKQEIIQVKENVLSILEVFSIVETPQVVDGKKFELNGEVIDNPINPKNMYGGGEWFVITDEYIWYVRQNAREGDNWSLNNVYVKGSAGGIGKRVEYDGELADKIRSLKR